MYVEHFESPVGFIQILASEDGLTAVQINPKARLDSQPNDHTKACSQQLKEYFQSKRQSFVLTYDLDGYSAFQISVWKALETIPFGQTISYAQLSEIINNPKAIRAVGAANGKNPLAIVIPCHRVIGSDGSMTGYASGIDIKEKLLMHENPMVFGRQAMLF